MGFKEILYGNQCVEDSVNPFEDEMTEFNPVETAV